MPVAVDEGHGATITLSVATWDTAALIKSITWSGYSRAALETSHLATANAKTFMPEDLPDYGTVTLEFFHIDAIAPPYSAAETFTATYPVGTGQATAATIACSAFLTDYKNGDAVNGEVMMGSATYKLTGAPTFTVAT